VGSGAKENLRDHGRCVLAIRSFAKQSRANGRWGHGTNYFVPARLGRTRRNYWTTDRTEAVTQPAPAFRSAGEDIILNNTFGCNPHRLKVAQRARPDLRACPSAAELARRVADAVVDQSWLQVSEVPTGELLEPMGTLYPESCCRVVHDAKYVACALAAPTSRGLKRGLPQKK